MRRALTAACGVCLIVVVTALSGCSKSTAPLTSPTPSSSAAQGTKPDKASEIAAAMAELSDDDRKIAEAQKFCPVGDSPLGSMGKPFAVEVKGRKVFLCCEGCKDSIERDPDKYLAKLVEQPK